jgi:16S rRNA (cytidine1402-2'-O)-methyltransferase
MDESKDNSNGVLYVVATPIGNLEDITLRALRILKEADLIACEDTRVAKKLLFRYEIRKPLLAVPQHSGSDKVRRVLEKLEEGKNVALITDAGTPGLSDPGNEVVAEAAAAGFAVSPIPGPNALGAIVSVAGINLQEFVFKGFPPHKKGRQTYFEQVAASDVPMIYYESPYRFLKNLELLKDLNPGKRLVVGRELTKMFEEVMRGPVGEVLEHFQARPGAVKGEFVIIAY